MGGPGGHSRRRLERGPVSARVSKQTFRRLERKRWRSGNVLVKLRWHIMDGPAGHSRRRLERGPVPRRRVSESTLRGLEGTSSRYGNLLVYLRWHIMGAPER